MKYIADAVCLSEIMSATSIQKNNWPQQISNAVMALHEASVIWGDAKAGNVLIDVESKNAILIDFGGGTTKG